MRFLAFILSLLFLYHSHSLIDRTYFNYLGLKITASPIEIKNAYESKKIKIQAIENEEERSKKLKLLTEAYETLSNENERKKYERYGKDVFRSIKELTCINKFNPENPIDTRKSPSFKLTIPVSISDIYNGTIIKAKYPKKSACPFCQGTGAKSPKDLKPCGSCGAKGFTLGEAENGYGQKFKSETICPICKGHGKTVIKTCEKCKGAKLQKQMQTIQFAIPPGLPDGNKLTFRNYGEEEAFGSPSDFQITIVQIPTKEWSRQNHNLIYIMEIGLEESLFGFTRSFQHLDGSLITVERTETTTKDIKHIVKGKGLINKQGYPGNLIIKFKITIPKFSDQQLDMWEDFFNQYD